MKCEKLIDELGTSVGQRKRLSPQPVRTHDLPNTGGVFYPLGHENSYEEQGLSTDFMWRTSRVVIIE